MINGKHYPLWSQFVERKEQFIGGVMQDLDDEGDPVETEITDITLIPNGTDSAFFEVQGKGFSCGFDCQYGGITVGDEGWITFCGFGEHIWRIQEVKK